MLNMYIQIFYFRCFNSLFLQKANVMFGLTIEKNIYKKKITKRDYSVFHFVIFFSKKQGES